MLVKYFTRMPCLGFVRSCLTHHMACFWACMLTVSRQSRNVVPWNKIENWLGFMMWSNRRGNIGTLEMKCNISWASTLPSTDDSPRSSTNSEQALTKRGKMYIFKIWTIVEMKYGSMSTLAKSRLREKKSSHEIMSTRIFTRKQKVFFLHTELYWPNIMTIVEYILKRGRNITVNFPLLVFSYKLSLPTRN